MTIKGPIRQELVLENDSPLLGSIPGLATRAIVLIGLFGQKEVLMSKVTKAQLVARIVELEAKLGQACSKITEMESNSFGGIDDTIPEGLIGNWQHCLIGVVAGEATEAQKKASNRTFANGSPVPVPLANARVKVRGLNDELDFAGIQLVLGSPSHFKDRGYRLHTPCGGKGEKKFYFYKSTNGFFGTLREALIKKAEEGTLAKVYAKAEGK